VKQRAFVVMPFGKEVAISWIGKSNGAASQRQPIMVNFDRVYDELLKPALEKAGCEAVRADSEIGAGDIRTDMFFELVTADVVVADLSIYNPNVYYELGVRDAVCQRGVFIVQGGWPTPRPFDVAQDRSFNYNGKLFTLAQGGSAHASPEQGKDIQNAVDQLAAILGRALASEARVTGSPVVFASPGARAGKLGAH